MLEFRVRAFSHPFLIFCLLGSIAATAAEPGAGGLRDALQATLRNHPAVAGQKAEVDARRYASDAAPSQRYPTLSAQAQHYTQRQRSVVSGEDLENPAILRVPQPIYAFGRINSSIAAANAEVSTERADLLRSWRVERRIFYSVDLEGTRRLLSFLTEDCCQGHPDLCGDIAGAARVCES